MHIFSETSVFGYLYKEVTRGYMLEHDEAKFAEKRKRVYTFMKIPRELEKVCIVTISIMIAYVSRDFENYIPNVLLCDKNVKKKKVFVQNSATRINLRPARFDLRDTAISSQGPITPSRAGTQIQTDCVNVGRRLQLSNCHTRIGLHQGSNTQPSSTLNPLATTIF